MQYLVVQPGSIIFSSKFIVDAQPPFFKNVILYVLGTKKCKFGTVRTLTSQMFV